MHILILAQRDDQAQKRILAAARFIADLAHLDPKLVDALICQEKDPAVRRMMEREAIANLLDALCDKARPEPELDPVTTVTEPESKPMDESIPGPVLPIGDELPPPVIEGALPPLVEGGPVSADTPIMAGNESGPETFIPAEPVEKPKKTSKGKSTRKPKKTSKGKSTRKPKK